MDIIFMCRYKHKIKYVFVPDACMQKKSIFLSTYTRFNFKILSLNFQKNTHLELRKILQEMYLKTILMKSIASWKTTMH